MPATLSLKSISARKRPVPFLFRNSCLAALLLAATPLQAFVHPGLLNNQAELDFIKSKIKAGAQPWKSGFGELNKRANEFKKWKPRIWPTVSANFDRKDPDNSRDDMTDDMTAVYGNALLWEFTGDEDHAKKAVEILMVWVNTLTRVKGGDAKLCTGYSWPQAIWGAEILRDFKGFSKADQDKFKAFLKTTIVPLTRGKINFATNWSAWTINCTMSAAVFMDDKALFNESVSNLRDFIKAYFSANGKCKETCSRGGDMWHTQMALAPATAACEIAWKQGVDVYSAEKNLLYIGIEYHAPFVNERDLKNWPCKNPPRDYGGRIRPWNFYEMAYNHYHNRVGLDAPQIWKVVKNEARPEKYDRIGWGTLTHAELPKSSKPTAIGLNPQRTQDASLRNESRLIDPEAGANFLVPWGTAGEVRDATGREAR